VKINTTYLNPVHNRSCPDPFVLKHGGEYWCYCTGFWHDGRCFGVLHSRDLIHWRELSGAMEPLPVEATCYWAPEVWYEQGRYLMYYSVGNEERMEIRVAVAHHPAGPFIDSGHRLTVEDFAIDAHVFEDDDGARYLFYATDFLTHSHIGTGTVRDRMLDPFTLAGDPQPVTRARYDWQIYDPQRAEKGGVRWHTIEGPFVLKHKGRYYQMFSGGNWKNLSYGVSYALSERIESDGEWQQVADGERVLPVLRTLPGKVVGPGHNSVVRGPDNQQLFCVYHRWSEDNSSRVLAIDRLEWVGEHMLVLGPSTTPQPAPLWPALTSFFDEDRAEGLGPGWECRSGRWMVQGGTAFQQSTSSVAEARCLVKAPFFVAELSLRALDGFGEGGAFGISSSNDNDTVLRFMLLPDSHQAAVVWNSLRQSEAVWSEERITLPPQFNFEADHLLRLEVNSRRVKVMLDQAGARWEGQLISQPNSIALSTQNAAAAFAGFALTIGWQDWFTEDCTPDNLGWETEHTNQNWRLVDQQLWCESHNESGAIISKGPLPESYELVINAKLMGEIRAGAGYGFLPALSADQNSLLLTVVQDAMGWAIQCNQAAEMRSFPLPADFDPFSFQQFRFRKEQDRLIIQYEAQVLGELALPSPAARVGLYVYQAAAAFEMVRVTALIN
jgi:GH43 family beta-xylosidase